MTALEYFPDLRDHLRFSATTRNAFPCRRVSSFRVSGHKTRLQERRHLRFSGSALKHHCIVEWRFPLALSLHGARMLEGSDILVCSKSHRFQWRWRAP